MNTYETSNQNIVCVLLQQYRYLQFIIDCRTIVVSIRVDTLSAFFKDFPVNLK
jgi:hypothetical protein